MDHAKFLRIFSDNLPEFSANLPELSVFPGKNKIITSRVPILIFFFRLYRYSSDSKRIFKRWLTFRNLYILSTDIVFLVAFILRIVAYINNQCRLDCPYEGNEIAFIAAAAWSFAALLAFLRIIQGAQL
jgi:hypothetical protein